MINISLKKNIIDYSKKLVQENNFGQRGRFDGNKNKQFVGVLAENVLRDYFGYELIKPKGFDDGWDIIYKNYKTDIKCMERIKDPKIHYVNNLLATQINYKSTAYIFTSLNTKLKLPILYSFTVCGWIDKETFKEKASFYKKGTLRTRDDGTSLLIEEDLYEIQNKDLYKLT
jgi:hypothetical protein